VYVPVPGTYGTGIVSFTGKQTYRAYSYVIPYQDDLRVRYRYIPYQQVPGTLRVRYLVIRNPFSWQLLYYVLELSIYARIEKHAVEFR
jgi:hypothetical protein